MLLELIFTRPILVHIDCRCGKIFVGCPHNKYPKGHGTDLNKVSRDSSSSLVVWACLACLDGAGWPSVRPSINQAADSTLWVCQSTLGWPRLRAACASTARKSGLNICLEAWTSPFKGALSRIICFFHWQLSVLGIPHALRWVHKFVKFYCRVKRFIWIDI